MYSFLLSFYEQRDRFFFTSIAFGCASSFFILNALLQILPSIFFTPILWALAEALTRALACACLGCAALLAMKTVSDLLLCLLSSLSLPCFSCFIVSNFIFLSVFLSISAIFSECILSCKSLINLFVIVTIMSDSPSVLSVSSSFVKSVFASSNKWNLIKNFIFHVHQY